MKPQRANEATEAMRTKEGGERELRERESQGSLIKLSRAS